jgi:hypothetical protein
MPMRTLILVASLWMLAVPFGCVVAGAPEKNAPASSVPLGNWHGRPVVDLTIAGEGPFRFILDSGAAVTVIDHALAGRFELKELGKTEIGSPLGGTVPATRLQLQDLRMGSIDLGPVEALDIDLAGVIGSGDSPVGVLATADLGNRSLVFDFAGDRLSVRDTLLPPANNADVFDFCSSSGKPSLHVQVGGRQHCVNLDTGSPSLLALPLSAADALPLAGKPAVRGRARLVGAEVDVWGARLDGELRVGEIVMRDPDLSFIETASIGNIGQGFLRSVELTLDHANRRLRVRAEGNTMVAADAPTPQIRRIANPIGKKRYGIRLKGSLDAELQVAGVDPGSPAEAGGLQAGDLVVALNGVPVEQLDTGERMNALRGSPLNMSVRRDGQLLDLTLRLD